MARGENAGHPMHVLLGVTGSVAAIHTPLLYEELLKAGAEGRIVATKAALYFFDVAAIAPARGRRNRDVVILDEDEWPNKRYERGDPVLHIELRRWADLLLIAPLDANTLAKIATGLADNCLTCVWRAWDPERPVILAPAMNTMMWEHPATTRHLRQIAEDAGMMDVASETNLDRLVARINDARRGLTIVPPVSKRLACDDVGIGAMAERSDIVAAVCHAMTRVASAPPAGAP